MSRVGRNDPASRRRTTRVVLGLGAVLVVVAVTGFLRADRGISVTQEQAVAVATQQIDFEPERTNVRLVRRGFGSVPFWAVSLSTPAADGGFEELVTVLVDARTGDVAEINQGS